MKTPAVTAFLMCYISALACNLINNQPMTILFTKIIQHSAFNVSADIQTVRNSI